MKKSFFAFLVTLLCCVCFAAAEDRASAEPGAPCAEACECEAKCRCAPCECGDCKCAEKCKCGEECPCGK